MYMTQAVHKGLREQPNGTAAICGADRVTRAELAGRVARFAGALQGLGLEPGDRIGMLALNSIRYLEYFFGVWWAGGVVNPCNIVSYCSLQASHELPPTKARPNNPFG